MPDAMYEPGALLHLVASADRPAAPGERVVVTDVAWTPAPGDARIGLRSVIDAVLLGRDMAAEATALLDGWEEASGVVEATVVDGTSFWYYGRLRHWIWLQERLVWLWCLDHLLEGGGVREIRCDPDVDAGLVECAGLVAASRRLTAPAPVTAETRRGRSSRVGLRPLRALRRLLRDRRADDRRAAEPRLDQLAAEPGRLLVVLQHRPQRVRSDAGDRLTNVFLDPIAERLRDTRLEPLAIRIRHEQDASPSDDGWGDRVLPASTLATLGQAGDDRTSTVDAMVDRLSAGRVSLMVGAVDLGPTLTASVATLLRDALPGQLRAVARIRRLLRRLRPAAILLADEYHRQDWLSAASLEGIPVAAVQHGLIYDGHCGYTFRRRPGALRLPDRLYVFGRWEARLLTGSSVFEPDEVRVGGSPRLDMLAPTPAGDVRAELGVAPGDRLVVVSGTWGKLGRTFRVPIGLGWVIDRPLPRVHLVVKLHPGETDEGPYRRLIEGAARAGGFEPPPVTVVADVDLYRLLAAADAHLGFQSTVLTEAVVVGIRNLFASDPSDDVLGWVAGGVARPVRDGGELLAALDDPASLPSDAARHAFLADHFEPGDASRRIADDLLAWTSGPRSERITPVG